MSRFYNNLEKVRRHENDTSIRKAAKMTMVELAAKEVDFVLEYSTASYPSGAKSKVVFIVGRQRITIEDE